MTRAADDRFRAVQRALMAVQVGDYGCAKSGGSQLFSARRLWEDL